MIDRIKPLALALLFSAWPLAALSHTHLDRAEPSQDAVLENAPGSVKLWFSSRIEPKYSRIEVTDGEGKTVHDGESSASENQRELSVDLIDDLAPGTYQVHWNVIARDGHRVRGDYSFSVK